MRYGQFFPIAKATEILGEKWTILVMREMCMDGRRFNELQRGRKSLEEQGMVVRRRIPGQKGYEYHPTAAREALKPVLVHLGGWGLEWARHTILDQDFDAEFLMFCLERSVDADRLAGSAAIEAGDLSVEGDAALTRNISAWLKPSIFHDSKRAPIPA